MFFTRFGGGDWVGWYDERLDVVRYGWRVE